MVLRRKIAIFETKARDKIYTFRGGKSINFIPLYIINLELREGVCGE